MTMPKSVTISTILVSPKVSLLVDEAMANNMLGHLVQMLQQPSNDLSFSHGNARSWGIELAAEEDTDRAYRVAFVLEDRLLPTPKTYLTMIALEEGAQLELPPEKRMLLSDWNVYQPS